MATKPKTATADTTTTAGTTTSTTTTSPTADAAPAAPMQATQALRLGNTVMVKLAPGAMLRNTETGGWFEADTPMPQTVTVTLLRRLADGDLVQC